MYKIIAVDLDGTLLNNYGIVEEETKNTLIKAKQKGTQTIIASGRPISSIKAITKEIESENYFIAGNGAIIYDIKKEKIIYERYIKKEKVLEIIKLCEENSISYNVYTDKAILATSLKFNVLYYHKENLKKEENKKTNIIMVEDIYKYVKKSKEDKYLKITVCDNTKIIFNSIIKKLRKIEGIEVLDISHMSRKVIKQGTENLPVEYFYTEILSKNVDKWDAIEYLIEKLNIKKEEVIAIGDNINDKKMIENAGIGIAMKGSTPVITQIADYITKSNNKNGVAKAIQKYILKNKIGHS